MFRVKFIRQKACSPFFLTLSFFYSFSLRGLSLSVCMSIYLSVCNCCCYFVCWWYFIYLVVLLLMLPGKKREGGERSIECEIDVKRGQRYLVKITLQFCSSSVHFFCTCIKSKEKRDCDCKKEKNGGFCYSFCILGWCCCLWELQILSVCEI